MIPIIVLFFLSFIIIFYILLSILFPPKTVLREQIDFYKQAWEKTYGKKLSESEATKAVKAINQAVEVTRAIVKREGLNKFFEAKLERSGLQIGVAEFILAHFSALLALGFIAQYLFAKWLLTLVLVGVGAFIPVEVLSFLEGMRRKRFEEQLPDTLLLIAGSLKAGYGFLQSLDAVIKETKPPVSEEFKKVLTQARLGLPLDKALDEMASRINSISLNWMVIAIKIHREVGGNLSEVLETLAKTIRERDRIFRQIRVLTAEGRLSALILFALPVLLMTALFILNPEYMALLFNNVLGLAMSASAVILLIIGAFWMRKIVSIEV